MSNHHDGGSSRDETETFKSVLNCMIIPSHSNMPSQLFIMMETLLTMIPRSVAHFSVTEKHLFELRRKNMLIHAEIFEDNVEKPNLAGNAIWTFVKSISLRFTWKLNMRFYSHPHSSRLRSV